MQYDYTKALSRINNLRRKVIMQKGGQAVDGLPSLTPEKQPSKKRSSKNSKTQDLN